MIKNGIILVAGVSGVGKSTLCERLVAREPRIRHIVAGSFVDGLRPVDQLVLAQRIRAAAHSKEGVCLVDGHLIVDGNKVPPDAVNELAPKAIVVVTGRLTDILRWRIQDQTRARPAVTEEVVDLIQKAEVQRAQELALTMGVPFVAADAQDSEGFQSKIFHLIGNGWPQGELGSLKTNSERPGR